MYFLLNLDRFDDHKEIWRSDIKRFKNDVVFILWATMPTQKFFERMCNSHEASQILGDALLTRSQHSQITIEHWLCEMKKYRDRFHVTTWWFIELKLPSNASNLWLYITLVISKNNYSFVANKSDRSLPIAADTDL